MKTFKTLALVAVISAGMLGTSGVMAAFNPEETSPQRSSGNFEIKLFNETGIQVYGLDDVEMYKSVGGLYNVTAPVCVAANVETYKMRLESQGGFQFNNNSNLAYTVELQAISGNPIPDAKWGVGLLESGDYSETPVDRDGSNTQLGCTTERKHQFFINLPNGDSADVGTYTDQITVTVEPV